MEIRWAENVESKGGGNINRGLVRKTESRKAQALMRG
jgi:hypothetical protein